jgi:hypothetical protein
MSSKIAVDLRPGHRGFTRLVGSGTDAHTATADGHDGWGEIQILEDDTAFSVCTNADAISGSDAYTGRTYAKGTILHGRFTAVTRSAGSYILYR